jgi:branched-chain amino acid aminotransferase
MSKNGTLCTPHADACLHGITRGLVLEICKENNIPHLETNLSLTEFYNADEVFATGTMGELTPVTEIDGRKITCRSDKNLLPLLHEKFKSLIPAYSEKLPF